MIYGNFDKYKIKISISKGVLGRGVVLNLKFQFSIFFQFILSPNLMKLLFRQDLCDSPFPPQ
jgi:hypothetical protein